MELARKLSKYKIDLFCVLLLLLISVWGLRSLFGGPYYTSQDGIHQIARLYHFKLALKDGVFPPRWANTAFYGYGYPLFHFNYHAPWYAAMPLIFLRIDLFDIMKILHFAAYFFSGVFMYIFLREIVKRKAFAFLGAAIYLISPYRFLNIYVRNATGEVFAFIFFPLVFYAMLKLARSLKYKYGILLAVSLAGIILSHAMSFVIFSLSTLAFFIFCVSETLNRRRFLWLMILSGLFFLSLSAYYLFPAFIEKKYTIFDQKFGIIYGRELLDLRKIIYTPWGYSGNGNAADAVMSFQFGLANWLLMLAGIFATAYLSIRKKFSKLLLLSILMIFISLFLSIKPSLFLWNLTAKLFLIDFPWKMVGVAVFWSAILAAVLFDRIKIPFRNLMAVALLLFTIYANRNHIRVNKYVSFDMSQAAFYERSTNTEDEYLPKWASDFDFHNERNIYVKNRIEVQGTKTYQVKSVTDKNQKFSYVYDGAKSMQTVKKFYFPGWQVIVNGKSVPFSYANGFYNFEVGKGISRVEIVYEGTALVKISNIVSFMAWLTVLIFLLADRKAPRQN